MKNVTMSIEGNVLTITADLSKSFGLSASGKSEIVASTGGNVDVLDRSEKIGLNIYRKPTPAPATSPNTSKKG